VKYILFFWVGLFTFSTVKSQTYDSLQVSLLTVAPRAKAVWTIFGHTALRLSDRAQKIDAVLNWGTFDSQKPNFLLRFLKGETDYSLSATPFHYFISSYSADEASVIEQVVNIPESEKAALMDLLETNLLPENTEYRYNFIFDNCTTRPRDILERFCGGKVIYPEQTQPITFRHLIHQYTAPYPWLEFGIDCIIGNGADSLISYRSELFLPEKWMDALNRATVEPPNKIRQPFVQSSKFILQFDDTPKPPLKFWNYPFPTGLLVFFLYLALVSIGYFKKRRFRFPFALPFFIAASGGCIVAGLCFFSVHPCVQSNWNLLWLHPFHLVAFTGFFFRKSYRLIRWYHAANFVLLSCFLLGWHWIPQEMNKACIPFILCLWIISGLQFVVLKQK
jgi:hypothetical protein